MSGPIEAPAGTAENRAGEVPILVGTDTGEAGLSIPVLSGALPGVIAISTSTNVHSSSSPCFVSSTFSKPSFPQKPHSLKRASVRLPQVSR